MDTYPVTQRTRLRRRAERGSYDRRLVHAILDEALVAHAAVQTEAGLRMIPATYARIDDSLYLHGSTANQVLRAMAGGAESCVTVTLLDGLVLARSAFHHSMNYRTVIVYGQARRVDDPDRKRAALDAIVDRAGEQRSTAARQPTDTELRATIVVEMPLIEVSAKVRTGGPVDDPEDLHWPAWAGVIPLRLERGVPVQA